MIDDCGAPMVSGSLVAQFSNGDPAVALAPLRNGQWTGVCRPAARRPTSPSRSPRRMRTGMQVVVRRGSSVTRPADVTIAPSVPAIFTKDNSGAGQGMIFAGGALADAANPAHAGDAVVIQCTGLGAVDRPAMAGAAAPDAPAASATTRVYVNIGGADAAVTAAVLQPGLTGAYQVMMAVQ